MVTDTFTPKREADAVVSGKIGTKKANRNSATTTMPTFVPAFKLPPTPSFNDLWLSQLPKVDSPKKSVEMPRT